MKKLALIFGLLFVFPAFAADNAVIVTPGVGVTMKSKDIGAGVQAMQPVLSDTGGNALSTPTAGADAVSNTSTGLLGYTRGLVFNGTTWDRWYGDLTNGGFVNVKASVLPTGGSTSANQTTINTSIGTTNTNLGPPGATVCATDTGSCSLNALFQRALQSLTTIVSNTGAAIPAGSATIGNTVAAPTSSSSLALTSVTCGSAVSSCVLKASAGNFYGVYAECTAACWLMVFNSTTAPSNGATTAGSASGNLVECISLTGTAGGAKSINYPTFPVAFSVGITAAISSTACSSLTLSTVGFVRGSVL